MKQLIKKTVSLLLCISLVVDLLPVEQLISWAATTTFVSGNYTYTLDEDENATITQYTGNDEVLVIPDYLDSHKVISIGSNVFSDKRFIKSVTLPKMLEYLGYHSFSNTSITFIN